MELLFCTLVGVIPILRDFFLFVLSLAWRYENLLPTDLRLPTHIPLITAPSLMWSVGMGLIYPKTIIKLLVADLKVDPGLRHRPVSSVAFAYLCTAVQLNQSIGFFCGLGGRGKPEGW
jgi:hypothetical protein